MNIRETVMLRYYNVDVGDMIYELYRSESEASKFRVRISVHNVPFYRNSAYRYFNIKVFYNLTRN